MSRFTVLEKFLWRLGRRKNLCSLEAEKVIIQAKSKEVLRSWWYNRREKECQRICRK